MNIAILTFDGFNELDSIVAFGILNRMKEHGFNVQITSPTKTVTSMNGLTIEAQQQLEFANSADVVLFGSGLKTRDIAKDETILSRLSLDKDKQIIVGQCSGTLLLSVLGILEDIPACTDLITKPWVIESGVEVLNQAFYAKGNIATAGGCLSSKYLATWIIAKLLGKEKASEAIYYVAPVGKKEQEIEECLKTIEDFLLK